MLKALVYTVESV